MLLSVESEVVRKIDFVCWNTEAFESSLVWNAAIKIFFDVGEWDSVVWAFWSRNAGLNSGKIKLQNISEFDLIISLIVS